MYYIDVKDVMKVTRESEYPGTDQYNTYLSVEGKPFYVKIAYLNASDNACK